MNKKDVIFFIKNIKNIFNFNLSFSQEGEDMLIDRLTEGKINGYYVDVGAHHPIRFSNTMRLYNRGWRGINIDAMPGSMKLFDKIRKEDINLEMGVGLKSGILKYYEFDEKALNTFDENIKNERVNQGFKVKNTFEVPIFTLKEIFEKYLPPNQNIDFMDIDVEGIDFEVLQSNDWAKFRPMYVAVEALHNDKYSIENDEVVRFLNSNAYILVAKLVNTLIFEDALIENESVR